MNINTLINIALLPVTALIVLLDLDGEHHTIMGLYILGMNLIAVYRSRKSLYIMSVCAMITYSHYCIIFKYFITDYSKLSGFHAPHGDISITGIIILCLFSYGLLVAVPKLDDDAPRVRLITEDCRDNPYIVAALVVLILYCIFIAYTPPPKGVALLARPNGWFRNVDKFLIILFFYSGNRKIFKWIGTLLAVIFCARSFIGGERADALVVIIDTYLSLYAKKVKMRALVIPAMLLLMLFQGIITYRGRLFYMDNVAWAIAEATLENKFIIDTPLGGYLSACSFMQAANFANWETRLSFFGEWITSMFALPQTLGGSTNANGPLEVLAKKYAGYQGGGIFEYHFYFFFGFAGILVAVLIYYFLFIFLKRSVRSDNGFVRCLALYYAASAVNTYLYTPSGIFRAGLVFIIEYYLLDFGHKLMKGAIASFHRKPST